MGHAHRRRGEEWSALAVKQTRKGQTTEAAESRRRAKLERERADAMYARALAAYRRSLDKDPGDYWALLWEAILHEEAASRLSRKGDHAGARPLYNQAIAKATQALRLKPRQGNVVRNARRIIEQARAALVRGQPVKKRPRRKRNATPGKSIPDP